ncbi:unnamed protein product [Blepharisma stoltei]|uniref:Uncharacterized protein n=1 Tax=Blepharisma stoltei TaxID=1481888 RepID=A0AAU9IJX7_9CILI|nr:unnamed protein product [Blepharisma stoltei]
MCKVNVECRQSEESCECLKTLQLKRVSPLQDIICPQPMRTSKSFIPSSQIIQILQQQNAMIKLLTDQNEAANNKLTRLLSKLESLTQKDISLPLAESPEESTSSTSLLSVLCGGSTEFQYFIKLTSEVPEPAYKERAFMLTAQIIDGQGNQVTLPSSLKFKIMIFTSENPPKLLLINTSGDKIMRGTTEVESNSQIVFSKVVIKEVTSHFRNGWFYLVIKPVENSSIKPLIIENLVIKARKMDPEGNSRKKAKIEEGVGSS